MTAFPYLAFSQESLQEAGKAIIDLGPLLVALVPFVGILLGAGILYLVRKAGVEKLIGQQKAQELLDKLIDEAVDYGVENLKDAEWTKVETKYEAVGNAINYAVEHGEVILKATGTDSNKLQQKLEAKLIKWDTAPGVWKD